MIIDAEWRSAYDKFFYLVYKMLFMITSLQVELYCSFWMGWECLYDNNVLILQSTHAEGMIYKRLNVVFVRRSTFLVKGIFIAIMLYINLHNSHLRK